MRGIRPLIIWLAIRVAQPLTLLDKSPRLQESMLTLHGLQLPQFCCLSATALHLLDCVAFENVTVGRFDWHWKRGALDHRLLSQPNLPILFMTFVCKFIGMD